MSNTVVFACRAVSCAAPLPAAAENGDAGRVRELVERGTAPHAHDKYGFTALHFAAQGNKLPVVRYLLSVAGPDPCECGATPLCRAAYAGNVEVCRLLLEAGAAASHPDASFGDRRTPLHKAASQGHLGVVRLLLAPRKALDAPRSGHGSETGLVSAVGCDVWARDRDSATAADVALAAGHLEIAREIEACAARITDPHGGARRETHAAGAGAKTTSVELGRAFEAAAPAAAMPEEATADLTAAASTRARLHDADMTVGVDCGLCGGRTVAVALTECCRAMVCERCARALRGTGALCDACRIAADDDVGPAGALAHFDSSRYEPRE